MPKRSELRQYQDSKEIKVADYKIKVEDLSAADSLMIDGLNKDNT